MVTGFGGPPGIADCYVESLIATFTKGKARGGNPEYNRYANQVAGLNRKMKQEQNQEIRGKLLHQKKETQRHMLEVPSNNQYDQEYRRLKYCRYADDFVLGAICSKSEAEEIYRNRETFLKDNLKLNTSKAKSGLKHHTEIIRFLGYDSTVRNSEKIVKGTVLGQPLKKRSLKAQITLYAPEAKLKSFADTHKYGNWETMEAIPNSFLSQTSDAEITRHYSAEMRGVARYYVLAENFSKG